MLVKPEKGFKYDRQQRMDIQWSTAMSDNYNAITDPDPSLDTTEPKKA